MGPAVPSDSKARGTARPEIGTQGVATESQVWIAVFADQSGGKSEVSKFERPAQAANPFKIAELDHYITLYDCGINRLDGGGFHLPYGNSYPDLFCFDLGAFANAGQQSAAADRPPGI
jgi:hypothetical protein